VDENPFRYFNISPEVLLAAAEKGARATPLVTNLGSAHASFGAGGMSSKERDGFELSMPVLYKRFECAVFICDMSPMGQQRQF
jgi:hypothetical protein